MKRFSHISNLSLQKMLRVLLVLFLTAVIHIYLIFTLFSYQNARRAGLEDFAAGIDAFEYAFHSGVQAVEVSLNDLVEGYDLQLFFSDETDAWRCEHLEQVDDALLAFQAKHPAVAAISINGNDGSRVLRCENVNNQNYDIFYGTDAKNALQEPQQGKIRQIITLKLRGQMQAYYMIAAPIYYIHSDADNFSRVFCGSIAVFLDADNLIYRSMDSLREREIALLVRHGASWQQQWGPVYPASEGRMLEKEHTLMEGGLEFTFRLPERNLYTQLKAQTEQMLWMTLVLVALYGLGFFYLVHSISASVSSVVTALSAISYDNLQHRLPAGPRNEFGQISRAVNGMLEKLEHMTTCMMQNQERLHQAQINRDQAKLRFFQSQINPHFLYNTLACMQSIAAAEDSPRIETMAQSMSSIMRYALRDYDYVRIADELRCLNDYLDIFEARYDQPVHLQISCEEELFDCHCLKMLLQPVVENCLLHGIAGQLDRGRILVQIFREGEMLHVHVTDNGCGISPQRLQELEQCLQAVTEDQETQIPHSGHSNGIGMMNIQHRLLLRFGSRGVLRIRSRQGHYTQIQVSFPLEKQE